jgi:hypothetical protein
MRKRWKIWAPTPGIILSALILLWVFESVEHRDYLPVLIVAILLWSGYIRFGARYSAPGIPETSPADDRACLDTSMVVRCHRAFPSPDTRR